MFGFVVAGIVAFFVYSDAKNLENAQRRVFDDANINPAAWAVGVFALMIVFLPWYLLAIRPNALKQIEEGPRGECAACKELVKVGAEKCPFCGEKLKWVEE